MKYKHNYIIDIIFAVVLVLIVGYGLRGTLSHMDDVRAAQAARALTETQMQTETESVTETVIQTEPETETEAAPELYEVVGGVNFRAEANGDSEIINVLADGDVVELIDKDNGDWWHCSFGEQEGYIYYEFLQEH